MSLPEIREFFDEETNTYSYIVADPTSKQCAVIDSVLNYDPSSGSTSYNSADEIIAYIQKNELKVEWILETHVHADHLSAAPYLKQKVGGKLAIGKQITTVQKTFARLFNFGSEFAVDGSQFDILFDDQDDFLIGSLKARVIHTPGHTPACVSYLVEDCVFVGDTLFMPDYGTARCDFPGGDASTLFKSINKLFALPDNTRVFMCHDYRAPGRDEYQYQTTIGQERKNNIHVKEGVSESEFIDMRKTRDTTLDMPKLILPSVQVNMRAGELPQAEDNGTRYLKIPLNKL